MEFIDLSSGSYVLRVEARDMEQVANRIVLRKLIDVIGELVSVCTKPCMSYRRPSYSWHTQHALLIYTDTPLTLTFVNNSPRVEGNRINIDFITSKPLYSATCYMGRSLIKNCTTGSVEFIDLNPASYIFKVVALDKERFGQKVIKRRTIHVLGKWC